MLVKLRKVLSFAEIQLVKKEEGAFTSRHAFSRQVAQVLTPIRLFEHKKWKSSESWISLTGKAPWVEIMTSTFSSDWTKALQNPVHSDVTFILEGNHKLDAHRLVLCAASKFFQKVFRFSQSEQVGKSCFIKVSKSCETVLYFQNIFTSNWKK